MVPGTKKNEINEVAIRVAALTDNTFLRISVSNLKCPYRSIASSRLGITALSRLPQIRSAVSRSTISASFTATSYTRLLIIIVESGLLYAQLSARIKAAEFNPDDYWWYLDLRRFGSVPHAGPLAARRTVRDPLESHRSH